MFNRSRDLQILNSAAFSFFGITEYEKFIFRKRFLCLGHFVNTLLDLILFKDILKAFGDFKNKEKCVWINVLLYVKIYIFWTFLQYTIHWDDKRQVVKQFPSEKIHGTKNALFFLSWTPAHHSYTFNSRFSYQLKEKVRLFKKVSLFLLKFILLFENKYRFPDFKT